MLWKINCRKSNFVIELNIGIDYGLREISAQIVLEKLGVIMCQRIE